jgi:glycine oxidase
VQGTLGSYDVAVVGGGVIGLASAWRAAQHGLRVAVVDPRPGRGSSYAAAGMLAPVTEAHYGEEALLRLAAAAAAGYATFVAQIEQSSGLDTGYRPCGTLAVALDAGDRAVLDDVRSFQERLGLDVRALTGRECRRLEPMLTPAVRGGTLVAGDHQVDPRALVAALLTAAQRAGVSVLCRRATALVTDDAGVRGLRLGGDATADLDGDVIESPTVLLAAGCRSGQLPGVAEDALPAVRPVKGQILRLRVPPVWRPFLSRTVRGTVRGVPVYLVPRADGELVVGATQEELGFDEQVTAGGVYQLLRDAHDLVPGISELPLVETTAGLRPGSPDNAPIVGSTTTRGLLVATGHHRNGVLLAGATADAVTALLTEGAVPPEWAAFTPARFATAQGTGVPPMRGALT